MATTTHLSLRNGEAAKIEEIPRLGFSEFKEAVLSGLEAGGRLSALFGRPTSKDGLELFSVLAHGKSGELAIVATEAGKSYPALTPDCTAAHWFEREIAEMWSVQPEGHPWLKPIRFHRPYRGGDGREVLPGSTGFFRLDGAEVHEVAVGPVHAGIIEPGHFRFQCHGEKVFHLEISLGYQHRGVERALFGGPTKRSLHHMETLAGDTSVGHATAYSQVIEALRGASAPARAEALRGIALELERCANHIGDLGALANDVGYLPTAAFCGRIRGDFLNLTALLCGNRFGRGMVRPGGVGFDADTRRLATLLEQVENALLDATEAVNLLWNTQSVLARFENTGALSRELCEDLGLVGVAARASGLERDARQEFPAGIYRFSQVPISTWQTGDVFARAYVRWLEIQRSVTFIRDQVRTLPPGPIRGAGAEPVRPDGERLAPDTIAVSLVEGWRGEICHVALTGGEGRFSSYKVIDPSFHNWMGLALALRGEQISDFPLCNKSFNLSYAGHDL
jgi:Ni,Fe-hydrogenase III large subunit